MNAQAIPVVTPESILAELHKLAPAAQRALAADFGRAFLARVPADELEQHGSGGMGGDPAVEPGVRDAARAGPRQRARVQPGRGHRLRRRRHRRADRQRRHVLPRRFGRHGAGRARPVLAWHRASGVPGRARRRRQARRGRQRPAGIADPDPRRPHRQRSRHGFAARRIAAALADVRSAFGDWQAMRGKMEAIAGELGSRRMPASAETRAEAQEFLRWAADNHFTFLGYREYEVCEREGKRVLAAVPGTGLGIMRGHEAEAKPRPLTGLAAAGLQARHQHRPADPDQDQLALDRASPGLHGLHRRAVLRRGRQRHRRAALPRPVHLQRLQPPPLGHPAGAPALRGGDGGLRPGREQP